MYIRTQRALAVGVSVEQKVKKHLESLGIIVNENITILSQTGGSVIVVIKEGRLALNKDIASKILVA
ncbi:MAG: FeoA family protein [Bacillales bacterium]|nr:FeoA family protein [Bacillales bacterium]